VPFLPPFRLREFYNFGKSSEHVANFNVITLNKQLMKERKLLISILCNKI
jgi:hypothetical protein